MVELRSGLVYKVTKHLIPYVGFVAGVVSEVYENVSENGVAQCQVHVRVWPIVTRRRISRIKASQTFKDIPRDDLEHHHGGVAVKTNQCKLIKAYNTSS